VVWSSELGEGARTLSGIVLFLTSMSNSLEVWFNSKTSVSPCHLIGCSVGATVMSI
jgi:hypothetical protein